MKYTVKLSERFKREFKTLDRYTQKIIRTWINKNVIESENPRIHGEVLAGNGSGQWRFRIGGYHLICMLNDSELIILALSAGHRKRR